MSGTCSLPSPPGDPWPSCLLLSHHSSALAWKSPWTEEPGGLQSMGSLGVRHDWATSTSLFTFMHWRRKWQPTPVFLPGESQGWGSLAGCRLWGRTESDMTERLSSSSSVSQILSALGSLLFNYNFLLEWWIVTFTIYTLFKQMAFNFIM